MSNILQAARSGMSTCAHVHDRNGHGMVNYKPGEYTREMLFSLKHRQLRRKKLLSHIRCSLTHYCLWFFVFCFLFFFGYTIKDNQIQLKLFQNCTEKKGMNHNIPIPKLMIRTTMKRCGTQPLPAYAVFSASKKMVQI